jgi:hypothetical protein
VTGGVVDRFRGDAVGGCFHGGRQSRERVRKVNGHRKRGLGGHLSERFKQPELVEGGRAQGVHESAEVDQPVGELRPDLPQESFGFAGGSRRRRLPAASTLDAVAARIGPRPS